MNEMKNGGDAEAAHEKESCVTSFPGVVLPTGIEVVPGREVTKKKKHRVKNCTRREIGFQVRQKFGPPLLPMTYEGNQRVDSFVIYRPLKLDVIEMSHDFRISRGICFLFFS